MRKKTKTASKRNAVARPSLASGSAFKRELRYVVLKRTDLDRVLNSDDRAALAAIMAKVVAGRVAAGKPKFGCVVVERDWPEYEPTWRAIEARVMPHPPESTVALREIR